MRLTAAFAADFHGLIENFDVFLFSPGNFRIVLEGGHCGYSSEGEVIVPASCVLSCLLSCSVRGGRYVCRRPSGFVMILLYYIKIPHPHKLKEEVGAGNGKKSVIKLSYFFNIKNQRNMAHALLLLFKYLIFTFKLVPAGP